MLEDLQSEDNDKASNNGIIIIYPFGIYSYWIRVIKTVSYIGCATLTSNDNERWSINGEQR